MMRKRFLVSVGLGILGLLAVACGSGAPTAAPLARATPGAQVPRVETPAPTSAPLTPAPSAASTATDQSERTGVWVTGIGTVSAEPDVARLTIGVDSRARTVEEARSKAADAMAAIVKALERNGVASKDIQTVSFSISPEYTFREKIDALGRRGEQVLVGYIVGNQVATKVRVLGKVGTIIDEAVRAGGDLTRIQGVSFTIDDPSALQRQARDKAVQDALAKAEQLAKGAGVTLGRPFFLSESVSGVISREPGVRVFAAQAAPEPTPISGGELEVTVTVQTAFSIR